jgi:hypothetical protein
MKRYTIDLGDRRFVVDVQNMGDDTYRVLVGDRWYNARISQGRDVGQDWDIVERETTAPILPTINITMPEQQAPVIHVAAPIVNVPQMRQAAPPQVTVNVPQQAAPIVRVEPAAVSVNIPDIKLVAGSVAKVKRDYKGLITEITSNAQVEGAD